MSVRRRPALAVRIAFKSFAVLETSSTLPASVELSMDVSLLAVVVAVDQLIGYSLKLLWMLLLLWWWWLLSFSSPSSSAFVRNG